jgi:hypothetical protein
VLELLQESVAVGDENDVIQRFELDHRVVIGLVPQE